MKNRDLIVRRFIIFAILLEVYMVINLTLFTDNLYFLCIMQAVKHCYLIALAGVWGTSLQRRILHKRIRHYLLHTDGAISLWITVRSLKFFVFTSESSTLYLWHLYYVPQLLMAYFAYATSDCLGKAENEPHSKRCKVYLVVTLLLIATVLTGNLHGLALYFDPVTKEECHGPLYYVIVAWIVFLIIAAIFRIPKHQDEGIGKKLAIWPYLIIVLGGLYCIFYMLPMTRDIVRNFEYTTTMCGLIVIVWEVIIQSGLIQGNTDYEWCFQNSTVNCQILNTEGTRVYQSPASRPLGEDDWYQLSQNGVFKPDINTEMLLARIRGGYVVWERDIKDINRAEISLLEAGENIKAATAALQKTIDEEVRHNKIKEQNRLYDKVFAGVGPKFEVLSMCIRFAQNATGNELALLIRRIDIIGVYAKRKSNLILLSEKSDADFTMELKLCFKETFDNLMQSGVDSNFRMQFASEISFETAGMIYDLLELVLEATLDNLVSFYVIVKETSADIRITMSIGCNSPEDCEAGRIQLEEKTIENCVTELEAEDNILNVTFRIEKKEVGV